MRTSRSDLIDRYVLVLARTLVATGLSMVRAYLGG
jgi:hypothetical protein